jgi:hypothetical protein
MTQLRLAALLIGVHLALAALITLIWLVDLALASTPRTGDEPRRTETWRVYGKPAPIMVWWRGSWWCIGDGHYEDDCR